MPMVMAMPMIRRLKSLVSGICVANALRRMTEMKMIAPETINRTAPADENKLRNLRTIRLPVSSR